jgi:hypothetical protein
MVLLPSTNQSICQRYDLATNWVYVGCWDRPGKVDRLSPSAPEPVESGELVLVLCALVSRFKAKSVCDGDDHADEREMVRVDAESVDERSVPSRVDGNTSEAAEDE